VVVARSKSIDGPWENCPHNPIVRTMHRDEPWWSRGHSTAVEGPDGRWWLVYHGYENGFRTLGRQMLLEPIMWTADGWPRATGGDLSRPLVMPAPASDNRPAPSGQSLSGFRADAIGTKLCFHAPRGDYLKRALITADALTLAGQGIGPADSSPLLFVAGDRSYQIDVELDLDGNVEAGLLLFYNERLFCGLGLGKDRFQAYRIGQRERWPEGAANNASRIHLRLVNTENVVTFYHSADGRTWLKERSFEVAGYNHNVADGFLSLRPGLYAAGSGRATFRSLRYRA
jgi:xylan 1,4-beta-xylosidase